MKNISSFLNGGHKGGNSKPIYPSGKSFGSPSTGGLNKKISAKQIPVKDNGKVPGVSNPPAKSEQVLDADKHAKSLKTLEVHYK